MALKSEEILKVLKETRSHRSFYQIEVKDEELKLMVEGARVGGSTKNSQNLRYMIIKDKNKIQEIFPYTKWAGMIDWNPERDEGPTVYIMICTKKDLITSDLFLGMDIGIAAQNISIMCKSLNYGSCMIGAYNKVEVEKISGLPEEYKSHLLIAIGKPKDVVAIVKSENGDTNYYREGSRHFVNKLSLEEIIID